MIEMHRTEIIEDILNDLKEIKLKAAKKETQNAIDYIVKRLKRDTSSNVWEEFELRFEQVHESFYNNLTEKHPDLTSRDKRLCALLKLNLTSKEISQITGQSSKSVENARTRLRKKLDITNSNADLSAYLSIFG
jgi:DNA-binding CsgD family transcriptional regulator